jgi:hypothetical protein
MKGIRFSEKSGRELLIEARTLCRIIQNRLDNILDDCGDEETWRIISMQAGELASFTKRIHRERFLE